MQTDQTYPGRLPEVQNAVTSEARSNTAHCRERNRCYRKDVAQAVGKWATPVRSAWWLESPLKVAGGSASRSPEEPVEQVAKPERPAWCVDCAASSIPGIID